MATVGFPGERLPEGEAVPPSGVRAPSNTRQVLDALCPGCGTAVDPLRAGYVSIHDGRFVYFCRVECSRGVVGPPLAPAGMPLAVAALSAFPSAGESAGLAHETTSAHAADSATVDRPSRPECRSSKTPSSGPFASGAIDALGIACGALVPTIGLLGPMAAPAGLPLTIASFAALVLRMSALHRNPADPNPLVVLTPTVGAVAAAGWATAISDPHAVGMVIFAALSCAAAISVEALVARARRGLDRARTRIEEALDVRVRVVRGGDTVDVPASEVRTGEQVVVGVGEIVGVDATVTAGEAKVVPWIGAAVEVVRREGDPILAGAKVLSAPLRVTTTWSGADRAWVKLLSSPKTRVDVAAPTARAMRLTIERGAPIAALVVGVSAVAVGASAVEVLAATCAGAIAFAARASCSLVAVHFARAHLEALDSGVNYKDARAFERAASANVAVLSARGTVLTGEPEIVAIESFGAHEVGGVLSLAAGAEAASAHPFAAAVLRAARVRGIQTDHVRNANEHPGLGITALASTGERLVVGGRAIMLEEKIGIAVTEARVADLEEQGRSVLLVALGGRVVGLIALQDGLRGGARTAVQKLLDARIEPVLLSGEARETCDTIGRALDIEHVRPEVAHGDRAVQVRALAEGGNVVAVIGHPVDDDGALGAADVAVVMGAAGATPGEWAAVLASDDVRDAALALALPHAARDRARVAIVLGTIPGWVALLAIGFGVAPLATAPLAVLLGAAAVAAHARGPLGSR